MRVGVAGWHLPACFKVWIQKGNPKVGFLEGAMGGNETEKLLNQVVNQKILEGKDKG